VPPILPVPITAICIPAPNDQPPKRIPTDEQSACAFTVLQGQ
jgi:hypothetical protein